MRSVRLLLLLPLAACAGAQPRPVARSSYNVPDIGGAGLIPLGSGGLTTTRRPASGPVSPGYTNQYWVSNLGAGLAPVGQHSVTFKPGPGTLPDPNAYGQPAAAAAGAPSNYNLPDSGGAGLLPVDATGVRQPAGQ